MCTRLLGSVSSDRRRAAPPARARHWLAQIEETKAEIPQKLRLFSSFVDSRFWPAWPWPMLLVNAERCKLKPV
eukprot:2395094-Prymnesium_polylepis.2